MNTVAIIVHAADGSLARADAMMLTDQMLMEALIDPDIRTNAIFRSNFFKNGDFTDCIEWDGVEADADGAVRRIMWYNRQWVIREPNLSMLPRNLEALNIGKEDHFHALRGSLDTAALPATLKHFHIYTNKFSGEIDFTKLPNALIEFCIHENSFLGSADLSALPPKIEAMNISKNQFDGCVNLEVLPTTLRSLDMSSNRFVGTICLTKLPRSLKFLYLSENRLDGTLSFSSLPENLEEVWLDDNQFTGKPSFENLPEGIAYLYVSGNKLDYIDGRSVPACVEL